MLMDPVLEAMQAELDLIPLPKRGKKHVYKKLVPRKAPDGLNLTI